MKYLYVLSSICVYPHNPSDMTRLEGRTLLSGTTSCLLLEKFIVLNQCHIIQPHNKPLFSSKNALLKTDSCVQELPHQRIGYENTKADSRHVQISLTEYILTSNENIKFINKSME